MFKLRLKDLREEKGVSQQQLANALNISQGSVGNWESGIREPNFETVKKIADYFGVSTDYLLGREDNPTQSTDQQLEGIDFALYGEIKDLTEEEKQDILNFVKFTKSQRKE